MSLLCSIFAKKGIYRPSAAARQNQGYRNGDKSQIELISIQKAGTDFSRENGDEQDKREHQRNKPRSGTKDEQDSADGFDYCYDGSHITRDAYTFKKAGNIADAALKFVQTMHKKYDTEYNPQNEAAE